MHAADSIAISRLQVKGDKRTSQALVRELEQASWPLPLPAHLQHAWVLVREIQVTGRARDLRRHTAKQLDNELLSAVRAIQGNAANANAIWFASLPELIAFLLVDLALGRTTHWYWSRWAYLLRYPKQEAIARLLCEHCEYLPAIFTQLQTQRQLATLWSQLSDGSAKTLARELLKAWSLPGLHTWSTDPEKINSDSQVICETLQAQAKLYAVWRPLLKGLDVQDGRLVLAAIVYGLTYTPLWLQQKPAALVRAFASVLSPSSSPRTQIFPTSTEQDESPAGGNIVRNKPDLFSSNSSAKKSHQSTRNTAGAQSTPAITPGNQKTPKQKSNSSAIAGEANAANMPEVQQGNTQKLLRPLDPEQLESIEQTNAIIENNLKLHDSSAAPTFLDGYEFTTQCGGFFYLLNPLHRLLAAERLAEQQEASVWHWLLDLYRVFVQQFPSLDGFIDPPLLRFILQQMQPEATAVELQQLSLQVMASPPGQIANGLFADLHRQFGDKTFWRELQSSPGFFATPARVMATASHWDIYFPLQAVRLDLRLAAWDINPGWLPWLGRVVNLHYVEQPIPTGGGGAS